MDCVDNIWYPYGLERSDLFNQANQIRKTLLKPSSPLGTPFILIYSLLFVLFLRYEQVKGRGEQQ